MAEVSTECIWDTHVGWYVVNPNYQPEISTAPL